MCLPGEASHPSKCSECGEPITMEVLSSNAGFYIGTMCCEGPISRESGYYPSRDRASAALSTGFYGR